MHFETQQKILFFFFAVHILRNPRNETEIREEIRAAKIENVSIQVMAATSVSIANFQQSFSLCQKSKHYGWQHCKAKSSAVRTVVPSRGLLTSGRYPPKGEWGSLPTHPLHNTLSQKAFGAAKFKFLIGDLNAHLISSLYTENKVEFGTSFVLPSLVKPSKTGRITMHEIHINLS